MRKPVVIKGRATPEDSARILGVSPRRTRQLLKMVDDQLRSTAPEVVPPAPSQGPKRKVK